MTREPESKLWRVKAVRRTRRLRYAIPASHPEFEALAARNRCDVDSLDGVTSVRIDIVHT